MTKTEALIILHDLLEDALYPLDCWDSWAENYCDINADNVYILIDDIYKMISEKYSN